MRHLPQKECLAFWSFAKREFGIDLIRGSTGHAVRRSPGAGFYCTHTNEFSDRVSAVTGYCQNNSFETEGYEKIFRWAYGLEDPSCGMPLDSALKSAGAEAWVVPFR
jgi:hypothetical protein